MKRAELRSSAEFLTHVDDASWAVRLKGPWWTSQPDKNRTKVHSEKQVRPDLSHSTKVTVKNQSKPDTISQGCLFINREPHGNVVSVISAGGQRCLEKE